MTTRLNAPDVTTTVAFLACEGGGRDGSRPRLGPSGPSAAHPHLWAPLGATFDRKLGRGGMRLPPWTRPCACSFNIEVVGIDALGYVCRHSSNADVVVDHQLGQLVAVDQDQLLAGGRPRVFAGLIRERRGGNEDSL